MKLYEDIGVLIPEILLPRSGVDLTRWAVVACDQYTSEPEYWRQVEQIVGPSPSTLNLFLPEIYLGKPGEAERVARAQQTMRQYLEQSLLEPFEGMVYIERQAAGRTRRGLMLCLDLERYDYSKTSQSLIRATEGTIVERIPPRMRIREGASLELPHILVLIDDPDRTVIEPVAQAKSGLSKRYDFDLMMDSGHLAGYLIDLPAIETAIIGALRNLARPEVFASKYGLSGTEQVLLFAMGDGNHSLATAKATWEKLKPQVGPNHPARFALVEIENVHDEGLVFEPIHRAVFGLRQDIMAALKQYFGPDFQYFPCPGFADMLEFIEHGGNGRQAFGLACGNEYGVAELAHPQSNLAVGSLQPFLDELIKNGDAEGIDYVHGSDIVRKLAVQPGTAGFFLPPMAKSDLFKTVILDGALPRKTFSMGEAREKRFYMECRRIYS